MMEQKKKLFIPFCGSKGNNHNKNVNKCICITILRQKCIRHESYMSVCVFAVFVCFVLATYIIHCACAPCTTMQHYVQTNTYIERYYSHIPTHKNYDIVKKEMTKNETCKLY